MVTKDNLDVFLQLLDHISDTTIINYLGEIAKHNLPNNIDSSGTEIYYFYGSKVNEILFRKVAKFIKRHYANSEVICFKGKGHCEDALLNPQEHIKVLDKILKK